MKKTTSTISPQSSYQKDRPYPSFPASMRWINIGARTLHIAVIAVLFGGFILAVPYARLGVWHWLTIISGMVLMVLEWMHDDRWWHRGKGLLIWLHLGLCLLIHILPGLAIPLLWLILISGCVGSHMPRRLRHWSIIEGWERREEFSRKG
ncbi:MAG: hypothetical protein AB7U29_10425 [Desulfobulbus sp.]